MAELEVNSITVPVLLDKLRKREWMVPQFQREFVWAVPAVVELVSSIIESRPIGMATLWEQNAEPEVELDPIWIPDASGPRHLGDDRSKPHKRFAILDGRQRCTAIAMAFGGLRAEDGKFRFSGRFFLNVATADPVQRVQYIREQEVKRKKLTTDAACIGQILFPLSSSVKGEEILGQWMRYLQALKNPNNYENSTLPEAKELDRQMAFLKRPLKDSWVRNWLYILFRQPTTYLKFAKYSRRLTLLEQGSRR